MGVEDDVTIGELARWLRGFQEQTTQSFQSVRQDTQVVVGKLERQIQEVRQAINEAPFIHTMLFEEVRKNNGERVGDLEKDISRLENDIGKLERQIQSIKDGAWTRVVIPILMLIIGIGVTSFLKV